MAEETQPKWEGKATVELKGPTGDQIWPFLEDLCNIQKWQPDVDTCYQLEGELGQPGLIRYCGSSTLRPDGNQEETKISWAKEKLIMINPIQRCLSYEILENNVGFKSYVATMKVLSINDEDGQPGCKIEWSFVADPIEGWPLEDFNSYINSSLQLMGQKMEQTVLHLEETQLKWEGMATVELKTPTADQVWPCLEDFCNIIKWFPDMDICYQVEGELGQPGLIRYCACSSPTSSDGSDNENKIRWAKEKLLMMNPMERCLSYEVLENNIGFTSYVATVKVLPINGSDGQHGCKIEWSYVADPAEGWSSELLSSYINSCLQFMANKLEQAFLSGEI